LDFPELPFIITKDAVAGIFMAYPAKMVAHDQCDRGQFNLYGYQGRWIVDNGGRQLPHHAWRDAHNLITVDNKVPRLKARLMSNFHHDAFITGFCSADKIMTAATADLTESYRHTYTWGHKKVGSSGKSNTQDSFKNAERRIIFMREKTAPPYLLVYDSIQEDDREHTYTLNLHTASENEVKVKDNHVEFHQYPVKLDQLSYVSRPSNKDGSVRYYYSGHPDAGYAEYKIKIPVAGEYNLYGFGRPGDKSPGGMDSFFIELDGRKINWGTNGAPEYRWSKINNKPFNLKTGAYPLRVLLREPQARVAKLVLSPVKSGIPLFNKPGNPELIMIDAGKPDKIVKEFIVGTEKINIDIPEADMTLWQLAPRTGFTSEVFPGSVLPHRRLQASVKAVCGKFLTFYYPRKTGMEKPELEKINENVSRIKWQNCTDLICFNRDKGVNLKEFKSDADLVIIRKKDDSVISFVIMNGSYLEFNKRDLIRLSGGKGIAGWSGDTLAVSGKNVFNFNFNFSSESGNILSLISGRKSLRSVTANGNNIKAIKSQKGWRAASPFYGGEVLKW